MRPTTCALMGGKNDRRRAFIFYCTYSCSSTRQRRSFRVYIASAGPSGPRETEATRVSCGCRHSGKIALLVAKSFWQTPTATRDDPRKTRRAMHAAGRAKTITGWGLTAAEGGKTGGQRAQERRKASIGVRTCLRPYLRQQGVLPESNLTFT